MEDGEPMQPHAAVTLAHAWASLLADLEARKLSNQTIRKYKLLKRQMEAYGTDRGPTGAFTIQSRRVE